MKKLAIAGASLALAAMPVVGVFAASGDVVTTTVDTLTLNIPQGCNITSSSRADTTAAFGTVNPGQTSTDGTSAFTITCNGAWKVTPSITTNLSNGSATISSGATALDGSVSEWALKLTAEGTGITNAFSNYAAVNGTSTVSGTSAASNQSITPDYKVSVAPGQATGDYTGTVTFTVANNS